MKETTKLIKRLIKNKRAITPVLSHLLLTVVAVAAMTIATTATYVITTNLRETMSERVIVEDLWFNNSTHMVQVYLRNTGKVAVHISAVYLNHTARSFSRPFNLEIGQHRWLDIQEDWASSSVYSLNIVTTRGTHIEGYYKTP